MAKGGFVVNWDGKQEGCTELHLDFDEHTLSFNNSPLVEVKDWSTFSVHAVTKQEAEDIVFDGGEPLKPEEVKKDG